ncbi:MAG: LemA family protein [Patescibacteria group bacterium]|nr:LemA family protein [Patescibacteria group bacterium]
MKKSLLIILAIVAIFGLSLISTYNKLITKTQNVDGQWAQVETQYQRRFDLIPNLVNSVKGIFEQEQDVFGAIADARTKYSGATSINDKAQAAGQVESALSRLLVIIENYPQLQSNTTVLALMDELAGTENRVSVERKRFNDLVRDYNTTIKRFPTNLIANLFSFDAKAFFEAIEAAEQAPTVDLSTP